MTSAGKQQSLIGRGTQFVQDCNEEIKKVSKPTKQETIQATLVTLVIMVFIAVVLSVLDIVFNQLMSAVLT